MWKRMDVDGRRNYLYTTEIVIFHVDEIADFFVDEIMMFCSSKTLPKN